MCCHSNHFLKGFSLTGAHMPFKPLFLKGFFSHWSTYFCSVREFSVLWDIAIFHVTTGTQLRWTKSTSETAETGDEIMQNLSLYVLLQASVFLLVRKIQSSKDGANGGTSCEPIEREREPIPALAPRQGSH
jgi:hypothetical protein